VECNPIRKRSPEDWVDRGYASRPGKKIGKGVRDRKGWDRQRKAVFACAGCGGLVDWLSAMRAATAQAIPKGTACTACGPRRNFRPKHYFTMQATRLEGVEAGTHTLVATPTNKSEVLMTELGGREAINALQYAISAMREWIVRGAPSWVAPGEKRCRKCM